MLRIHTHCQVAQKSLRSDQNLPKSMAAPTHRQTKEKSTKTQQSVYVIAGFEGICRFISRINFLSG